MSTSLTTTPRARACPSTTPNSFNFGTASLRCGCSDRWFLAVYCVQSRISAIWIGLNITAFVQHWDPYPSILLNLVLSFQAVYTAPIIMMSQNRQADTDRQNAKHDYEINIKAELEIELLPDKLDRLERACIQELSDLVTTMKNQRKQLDRLEILITEQASIAFHSDVSKNSQ